MLKLDRGTVELLRRSREAALEANLDLVAPLHEAELGDGPETLDEMAPWILHPQAAAVPRPLKTAKDDQSVQIFYQDLDFRLHTR